jgi:single-strand DNA-binding protein
MFNKVILIGHLSKDVELKYATNGTAIAVFSIATNRTYKDMQTGENKQETMFIDVKVFGRQAETANQYLHKGKRVLVEGRLALEQWVDKTGQKRSKHVVVAEKVQFMDSKQSSNDEANQARNYRQSANYAPSQSNNNQAIPSVDIDEDEIPF